MDSPKTKKYYSNLKILQDVMGICNDQCNIKPVVLFGTLLGIIRDKDLIQWNNDIELGVRKKIGKKLK